MTVVNYDFKLDLPIAQKTEHEVSELFLKHYGHKTLGMCYTKYYDILLETKKGKAFTVEVKEDFTCERTGNVGLEFECRGRPSGISVTEASHYVYKIHTLKGIMFFIIKTDDLKDMIAKHEYRRIVSGGDKGSNSMNYLFDLKVFTSHATQIFI